MDTMQEKTASQNYGTHGSSVVQDSSPAVISSTNEKRGSNEIDIEERVNSSQDSPPMLKFWTTFLSLCLLGISTSLESTIVPTALPTIVQTVGDIGGRYTWIGNAFFIASAVPQPSIGQLADVFGRRWPLIISTALFALGSGIAGGANNADMLIAGRTLQGLGAGGIFVLVDTVVCDLVPLQQRAKYLGLVRVSGAIGVPLGPVVGGALASANWRWCFYLTLVTSGLSLVFLVLFLDLKHEKSSWNVALGRLDYVGTIVFTGSMTSLLLGLIMGGNEHPWSSAKVVVPIVIGIVGWAAFHIFESTAICREPMVPGYLFLNRTSAAGYFMAFDGALFIFWVTWFLQLYFQGILGVHPLTAGVYQLAFSLLLVPSGIIAGLVMGKTGKYRPQHLVGFGLLSIGIGLFTMLSKDTPAAAWAWFEIITALGLGVIMTAVLPAIQAALSEADIARSTAVYTFLRSVGGIWGVTIPSIVFNGQVNNYQDRISSTEIRQKLSNGQAYGFASMGGVQKLPDVLQNEVLGVYTDALKTVWQVGLAFALAGFLAALVVKQYDMSRKSESKFGLQERNDQMVDEETDVKLA
ncbi:MFS general substrate transporter [Xylaria cubensis]|nr:MFS general substrate transporter [Xylaria cubensis]